MVPVDNGRVDPRLQIHKHEGALFLSSWLLANRSRLIQDDTRKAGQQATPCPMLRHFGITARRGTGRARRLRAEALSSSSTGWLPRPRNRNRRPSPLPRTRSSLHFSRVVECAAPSMSQCSDQGLETHQSPSQPLLVHSATQPQKKDTTGHVSQSHNPFGMAACKAIRNPLRVGSSHCSDKSIAEAGASTPAKGPSCWLADKNLPSA